MLRRFLAFLLILGLATPALGAPPVRDHAAPVAAMASHSMHHADHGHPTPDRQATKRDCIGCAPGVAAGPISLAAPSISPLAPTAQVLPSLRGLIASPQTPPPRTLS